MERPNFDPSMKVRVFEAHYWYKTELVAICRAHGIRTTGTKIDLTDRLRTFLKSGQRVTTSERAKANSRRLKTEAKPLTLRTRLIPGGFRFNDEARAFFAARLGKKKFSFTKEMAQALRDAEASGDTSMTVRDLLEVYRRGQLERKAAKKRGTRFNLDRPEEKTAQWNAFVADFHRSPATKDLPNKMRVAAYLWRAVRDRPGSKRFSKRLLTEFAAGVARLS